ncbi:MAG TPA: alpha/beta fold hydrolase [Acidimicrobiia bacterium]|nr:alpha/beta fold hydrolase [Acidimicrobiia bacterium]
MSERPGAGELTVEGPVGRLAASRGGTAGGGLPVVLVHGINMDRHVWDALAARLGTDRETMAIDLRGHGDSVMAGPFDAGAYADDVLAVMDAAGIERAHLVGTSFGGAVTATVAARVPERVASVTAIGSAVSVAGAVDIEGGIAAMAELGPPAFFRGFMAQASFAPGTDPQLVEEAVAAATRPERGLELIADVVRTAFSADAGDAVAAVKAPALVLTGEHDQTCPIPAGEVLAAALGTELQVLAGRGHMAVVEDPDGVAAVVRPHLAANDGPAAG